MNWVWGHIYTMTTRDTPAALSGWCTPGRNSIRPAGLQTLRCLNKNNHCFLFNDRENPDVSDIPIKVCKNSVIRLPLVQFSVNAAPEALCCQVFLINAQRRLWYPLGSNTFTGLTVEVLVQYYSICPRPWCVQSIQAHWLCYCDYFKLANHVLLVHNSHFKSVPSNHLDDKHMVWWFAQLFLFKTDVKHCMLGCVDIKRHLNGCVMLGLI